MKEILNYYIKGGILCVQEFHLSIALKKFYYHLL